jgi:uncharacterized protein YecA (UPF0149 family)
MATQLKTKKKKMGLDEYFRAIQMDIARMATKDELALLSTRTDVGFKEVRAELRGLREDIKRITEAAVTKADFARMLREELEKFLLHVRN